MVKRTAWLYAGLPQTGGPAVAEAAAAQTDTLRGLGIDLPAESPEQMRRASAEILRDHKEQGYRRRDVEGAWSAVSRRAWRGKGTSLLGDERLAGADDDQIALLLDGLAGMRPRAVLALRDPASLLVEGWAAEVRQGRGPTFERYAGRVLDPDAEHQQASRFHTAHDLPAALDRWVAALGPDRVHAVVLPPDRDPGRSLWCHLLELLGADPAALEPPPPRAAAGAGTAVQRQINDLLKGRLSRGERRDVLGDWLPEADGTELSMRLPDEVLAETTAWGEKWRARVAESGIDVRGDLDHLVPASSRPASPGPGDAAHAAALAIAASALSAATVEVANLRDRVAELEAGNRRLEQKRTSLKRRLSRDG